MQQVYKTTKVSLYSNQNLGFDNIYIGLNILILEMYIVSLLKVFSFKKFLNYPVKTKKSVFRNTT